MIGALRLLNFRRTTRQPMRALLAVVAVAAGVALAVSVLVVSGSLKGSWARYGRTLGGFGGLRVIGASARGGLDESVTAKVAAVPGVSAAVPMVQAVTLVDLQATGQATAGTTVVALGVDCRIEELIGPVGCSPEAVAAAGPTTPPLISTALAARASSASVLRTDLGEVPLVGPFPAVSALNRLNRGLVVVLPLPEAQQVFARQGTIDVIYVRPAAGVSAQMLRLRLAQAVGPNDNVVDAATPPPGAALAITLFLVLLGMLSLFSLAVGGVLIYNTLTLTLEERRQDLAIAAALGASPAMLRAGVLIEASLLGLAGGVLGTASSLLVARPITTSLSGFVRNAIGLTATARMTLAPAVAGLGLGAALALVASWQPARRAIRADVAAELAGREHRQEAAGSLHYRRAVACAGIGALGVLLTWVGARRGALEPWQPLVAQAGMLLAVLGFLLASGALAPIMARAGQSAVNGRSGSVRLGVANLSRQGSRTGVMAVAVAASVGTAVVIASFTLAIRAGIMSNEGRSTGGRLNVSAAPLNNSFALDTRPPPGVVTRLAAFPGVQRVDREYVLLVGNRDANLVGVEAVENESFNVSLIRGRADTAAFARGEVVVGAGLARARHLRPGSVLSLPALRGMANLRVLAVSESGDFNGRNVEVAPSVLNDLWGPQPPLGLLVQPAPGVAPEALASRLTAARIGPYLSIKTSHRLAQDIVRTISLQMAPFWVMQRTLLLVAFIAVLSTLLLLGLQRRREFGLLAAVGMAPRELAGMIVAESAAIGVIGTVLGTAAGIAIFEAMREEMPILVGFHNPFRVSTASIPLYGAIAIGVVVLAAGWPAWRTARLHPSTALQYE